MFPADEGSLKPKVGEYVGGTSFTLEKLFPVDPEILSNFCGFIPWVPQPRNTSRPFRFFRVH